MTETQLSEKELVEKFYTKPFKFSYSSLNKLLYSPRTFYNWYIMREQEDRLDSYLIEGKVIHCLILEKERFAETFSILPGNIPTATSKKVVEAMYAEWKIEGEPFKNLADYKIDILGWLIVDNTYQNLKDDKDMSKAGAKTGDEKRLEKLIVPQNTEYFEYLKASKDKDVIDQEMYDRCEEIVDDIKKNEKVSQLLRLGSGDFELEEVHNELLLEMELEGLPFGLKGIIDNLVVDHKSKTVYINDIKTTGKSLTEFTDSVEYYRYWMQAVIYVALVKNHLKLTDEWKIVFHFVVIDKYKHIYPIPVSNESLLDWQKWFNEEILPAATYHYTKKDYTLPYKFALDQVQL
jgi:hypothetical protein